MNALYKLLRLYWMLIETCLPKFDIYQGAVAPYYCCPIWISPCLTKYRFYRTICPGYKKNYIQACTVAVNVSQRIKFDNTKLGTTQRTTTQSSIQSVLNFLQYGTCYFIFAHPICSYSHRYNSYQKFLPLCQPFFTFLLPSFLPSLSSLVFIKP